MQGRRPCTRVAAPPHLSAYYAMLWLLRFVITQPNIPEEQVAYRQCPSPLPRRRGSARLHVAAVTRGARNLNAKATALPRCRVTLKRAGKKLMNYTLEIVERLVEAHDALRGGCTDAVL